MAAEGQIHIPIRLLHRDLAKNGFPILRYQIRWTPEQRRPLGYVTHGTDRVFWAFREDMMVGDQVDTARRWLDAVDEGIRGILRQGEEKGGEGSREGWEKNVRRVLTLKEDRSIGLEDDAWWDGLMELAGKVLPGEPRNGN